MKILNSYLSTWGATQRISLTDKVSNDWIRDLGFNPHLHQK